MHNGNSMYTTYNVYNAMTGAFLSVIWKKKQTDNPRTRTANDANNAWLDNRFSRCKIGIVFVVHTTTYYLAYKISCAFAIVIPHSRANILCIGIRDDFKDQFRILHGSSLQIYVYRLNYGKSRFGVHIIVEYCLLQSKTIIIESLRSLEKLHFGQLYGKMWIKCSKVHGPIETYLFCGLYLPMRFTTIILSLKLGKKSNHVRLCWEKSCDFPTSCVECAKQWRRDTIKYAQYLEWIIRKCNNARDHMYYNKPLETSLHWNAFARHLYTFLPENLHVVSEIIVRYLIRVYVTCNRYNGNLLSHGSTTSYTNGYTILLYTSTITSFFFQQTSFTVKTYIGTIIKQITKECYNV